MESEKIVKKFGISFELNKTDFTASIIDSCNARGSILIPRSIINKSNEYFITKIKEGSFKYNDNISSIIFPEDSKLQIIEKKSFFRSSIQSITISSSVELLQEGWCSNTTTLTKVFISPNNKVYSYADKEQKIIIGKSDKNNKSYDVLVFACRDINHAKIPSSIKHIDSFSFFQCEKLTSLEISENSELLSIGEFAFTWCQLQSFFISSKVEFLEDSWCAYLSTLVSVSISSENKNFAFTDDDQKMVVTKSDKNNEFYDVLAFVCRDAEHAKIPKFVKHISSFAFYGCNHLKEIKFEENSELLSISKSAFVSSSIEKLQIPSKLQKIEEGWCNYTKNLIEVSISPENKNFAFADEDHKMIIGKSITESDSFDVLVFACRDIEHAIIPKYIKHISSFAFYECTKLSELEFEENSELISIGKRSFSHCSFEKISIPSSVKKIGKSSFLYCQKLTDVEFSNDPKLDIFDKSAFSSSSITNIRIPSKIKEIKDDEFSWCSNLETIEFDENSEVERIGEFAISGTLISKMTIPSNVKELEENWCSFTSQLKEIFISPKNKNFVFIDEEHKLIVGKSNEASNEYDVLVFACRDVKHVIVPSYIKYIASSCFNECKGLKSIEFEENSQLCSIGQYAFTSSALSNISLPLKLNQIGNDAFSYCFNLRCIEYLGDNKFDENFCFLCCSNLLIISFPNINEIRIDDGSLFYITFNNFSLFIHPYSSVHSGS